MLGIPGREALLERLKGENARGYIADSFGKYASRFELSRFLGRYELFKLIQNVRGSIIECGVQSGVGLLEWWHLIKMLDSRDRNRSIFGFDTFTGFPDCITEQDGPIAKIGGLACPACEEIKVLIKIHDNMEKLLAVDGTKEEVEFEEYAGHMCLPIAGDFMTTGDAFIKQHPELVIALLFMDFDIYKPTKKALELFLPRMPKGAVLVFDELNDPNWPGETIAVMETIGLNKLELKKLPCNSNFSYAVM